LVLLGGTRNEKDEELVKGLRKVIDQFSLNVSATTLIVG
jgi:hypothetical protein